MIILVLFMFNPYSQTVEFSRKLKHDFKNTAITVSCISRTPFETQSNLPMVFYKRNVPNISIEKVSTNDSLRYLKTTYVATTFNQIKNNMPLMDSLGYKPVLYSSGLLWNLNEYLFSKKINTINDIWVLYKKKK